MTLQELSKEYYATCAGLTRRIESLRQNYIPGDRETGEKIAHYIKVRGELRRQARFLEHYYDGRPRAASRRLSGGWMLCR